MPEAYIYDAIRTPRGKGKKGGGLNGVKPMNLLAGLLEELQRRNDLDTSKVDDIVMGCVSPIKEQGQNIAKIGALLAGWDDSVAGVQINRYCASGIETANIAGMKINSGWEDLVVVGGVESMSRIPMGSDGGPPEDPEFGFRVGFIPQGIGADMVATMNDITRDDVDEFAMASQRNATKARANGYWNNSIIPVKDENGLTILAEDEYIKPDCTKQGLQGLAPAFADLSENMGFTDLAKRRYPELAKINHVHTPGNSSGIVDGASALLVGSEKIGKDLNLTPRARIVGGAVTSTEPKLMMTGPGPASIKALEKAGLKASDIDLFEVNEAFASIPLLFAKQLNVPLEKINVNGGAIALGHPLGATGGMMIGTLVDELERRNLKRGLATVCAGMGIGIAIIVERV